MHVHNVTAVQDLDGSGPHHVQEFSRLAALDQDHVAGGEELHVRGAHDVVELGLRQLVERRVKPQEARYIHTPEYPPEVITATNTRIPPVRNVRPQGDG